MGTNRLKEILRFAQNDNTFHLSVILNEVKDQKTTNVILNEVKDLIHKNY